MIKIITKTMQIDSKEFQKCKSGQEFKANFINNSGPRPPVGMPKWFKTWSEEIYEKKQPKWFKTWSEEVYEKNQRKQDEFNTKIETRLDKLEENDRKIFDILNRNKLH